MNEEFLTDMRIGIEEFFTDFADNPENLSGWGHNYFCEEDGGFLRFLLKKPNEHECPICGKVYTEERYCQTWTYLYRVRWVQETLKAAYYFSISGDDVFNDTIKQTWRFYAKNYGNFALHEKDRINPPIMEVGGVGRIMSQGLNEGIMVVKLLAALDLLGFRETDEGFLAELKTDFFTPIIELLKPQIYRVHNIKCWLNSAVGMAGLFFQEEEWLNAALYGEYNLTKQLNEGVTADNFWYEGSIHYNFFTLEGVLAFLLFCKKYGNDFWRTCDIPRKMLLSAHEYAFDNAVLPNPNDGWANVNLKTYLFLYYSAWQLYEDERLAAIISAVERAKMPRVPLPLWDSYHFQGLPVEKFLYAAANKKNPANAAFDGKISKSIRKKSVLYSASNFAILRNERVNLFLKYGHNAASHAHPDKMTFELTVDNTLVTRDLSNAGYGAKICNEWHRTSTSHNTVVVDGLNHVDTEPGEIVAFAENAVTAVAFPYPQVKFTRHFTILEDGITDIFHAEGETLHIFDYFLHIDGEILCEPTATTAVESLGFCENGYQHIKNVRQVADLRAFEVLASGTKMRLVVDKTNEVDETNEVDKKNEKSTKIFLCETLDNPVTKHRQTIIIRKYGKTAKFTLNWHF
ncbi:MAG: heparinase II/III-family protein [Defluviitaleaceae bacterium]|nr:heparinase II/III-family protein [Defluviitaleaceae bacterium]